MTQTPETTVTCLACKQVQPCDVRESINVAANPELKEKLLRGEMNSWKCRACGAAHRFTHNLLYHDPGNHLLIWVRPDGSVPDESSYGEEIQRFIREATSSSIRRLVVSMEHLLETIRILEAGLDDRAVSLLKDIIARKQEWERRVGSKDARVVFQECQSGEKKKQLLFDVSCRERTSRVKAPWGAYEHLLSGMPRAWVKDVNCGERWPQILT